MSHAHNSNGFRLSVRRLFAFGGPDDWFTTVAAALRDVVACDSVTWAQLAFGTAMPMADAGIDRPHDNESLVAPFRATYHQHPITPERIRGSRRHEVYFTHDFTNLGELRGTDLYREVFRELEITHQARLVLSLGAFLTGLGVNRTLASAPFSEPDRKALSEFNRWVVQSHRLAEAEKCLVAMNPTQSNSWLGRAVVSRNAFRQFDGQAEPIIAQFFPEYSSSTRLLPERLTTWLDQQQERVRFPHDGRLPDAMFAAENATGRLSVYWKLGAGIDESILLFHYAVPPSLDELIVRFRERSAEKLGKAFTERQAETLLWLVQGESNKGIAQKMGIKLTTVKRNLEAIYGQLTIILPDDVPTDETRGYACKIGKTWLADQNRQFPSGPGRPGQWPPSILLIELTE